MQELIEVLILVLHLPLSCASRQGKQIYVVSPELYCNYDHRWRDALIDWNGSDEFIFINFIIEFIIDVLYYAIARADTLRHVTSLD